MLTYDNIGVTVRYGHEVSVIFNQGDHLHSLIYPDFLSQPQVKEVVLRKFKIDPKLTADGDFRPLFNERVRLYDHQIKHRLLPLDRQLVDFYFNDMHILNEGQSASVYKLDSQNPAIFKEGFKLDKKIVIRSSRNKDLERKPE